MFAHPGAFQWFPRSRGEGVMVVLWSCGRGAENFLDVWQRVEKFVRNLQCSYPVGVEQERDGRVLKLQEFYGSVEQALQCCNSIQRIGIRCKRKPECKVKRKLQHFMLDIQRNIFMDIFLFFLRILDWAQINHIRSYLHTHNLADAELF